MNPMLGKRFKDVVTGFKGVAVGYIEYISGCNQVLLVPRVDKDGKAQKGEWYDAQRLAPLKDKGAPIVLDNGATPGCDNTPKPQG